MRLLLLLLLFFLCSTNAFSEFGYLFPHEMPSSILMFSFQPRSCNFFDFKFTPLKRSLISNEASSVLANFDLAITNLEKARKISRNIPPGIYSIGPPTGMISLICFQYGVMSVNYAASSIRASLAYLDQRYLALDQMQGDEDIFSADLISEKKEIESRIKAGNAKLPIEHKMMSSSANLSLLWRNFPNQLQRFSVVSQLIGAESILGEIIELASRVNDAISRIEAQQINVTRNYQELLFLADESIKNFKEKKIPEIKTIEKIPTGENYLSVSYSQPNFFEESKELEYELRKAKMHYSHASKVFSSKERGHVAYSIVKKNEAILSLSEIIDRIGKAEREAFSLEVGLKAHVDELSSRALRSLEKKKGEPLVYNYLSTKYSDYESKREKTKPTDPLGIRINSLIAQSIILLDLIEASSASDFIAYELTKLKGMADTVENLISRAEKDGIEVFSEERSLFEIMTAIGNFQFETDGLLIKSLEDSLKEVEYSILKKSTERYSYLEDKFWELDSYKTYLPLQDQFKLDTYGFFFDVASIEHSKALGSLKSFEQFILKKTEEFEIQKPKMLADHYGKNLYITEVAEISRMDEPISIISKISILNFYELEATRVKVKVPLPENAVLLDASGGITLEKEGDQLFLVISQMKKEYNAMFEYELIPHSLVNANDEISSFSYNEMTFSKRIRFKSIKKSQLLLELDLLSTIYEIRYAGIFESFMENDKLKIIILPEIGTNTFEVEFRVVDPLDLKVNHRILDDFSEQLQLVFTNKYANIPKTSFDYVSESNCDISEIIVLHSDFDLKDASSKNFLNLALSTKNWNRFEEKTITLKLLCKNAISDLLQEEVELVNASSLKDVLQYEEVKQLVAKGNYEEAVSILASISEISVQEVHLKSKIDNIQESILRLKMLDYHTELLPELEQLISSAEEFLSSSDIENAENTIAKAEGVIEVFIEEKIMNSRKYCGSICSEDMLLALEGISANLISKRYADSITSAYEFGRLIESDKINNEQLLDEKTDSISSLEELSSLSLSAFDDFESFFFVDERFDSYLKNNLFYRDANSAKGSLEKLLKELANIKNAILTDNSEKYSSYLIEEKIAASNKAYADLIDANSRMKQTAESELNELEKRNEQFGSNEMREDIIAAFDAAAERNFFTAYMLAKDINDRLIPKEAILNPDFTIYVIPSVVILLGISYFLLFRKPSKEQLDLPDVFEEG